MSELREVLLSLKTNVVLDVGANEGWFAWQLRQIGFEGEIHCFEPLKAECEKIRAKANGDKKWHVHPYALGEKEEVREFNQITSADDTTTLSSFLTLKDDYQFPTTSEALQIRCLDEVLPGIIGHIPSPRIFLKMDTQGFDLEVWKGARNSRSQIVGLQSEIAVQPLYANMTPYTSSLETFHNDGYRLVSLWEVRRTEAGTLLEYDCILKKAAENIE